jgi:phosphopantothenoylcysteine decarboxylase/phosphopantothenate--cysteine ligase
MHEPMYDHPGVLESIEALEDWGVRFVDPRIEEDKAKIAADEAICLEVARATTDQSLADRTIIVTSGATTESIDPIRTLSNRASGRTGRAVARACYARGADVVLIHDGADVPWATVECVESATEMLAAVETHAGSADALISAAAVADYTVETASEKIRSGQDGVALELAPTPKILDTVREANPDLPIVGFKAETEGDEADIVAKARTLLERVGCVFVVGNEAGVMGETETRAVLVRASDVDRFEGSKTGLGTLVADTLAAELD